MTSIILFMVWTLYTLGTGVYGMILPEGVDVEMSFLEFLAWPIKLLGRVPPLLLDVGEST